MASKEDMPTLSKQKVFSSNFDKFYLNGCHIIKESGPFVEAPCIFLCIQNINYAEILA